MWRLNNTLKTLAGNNAALIASLLQDLGKQEATIRALVAAQDTTGLAKLQATYNGQALAAKEPVAAAMAAYGANNCQWGLRQVRQAQGMGASVTTSAGTVSTPVAGGKAPKAPKVQEPTPAVGKGKGKAKVG